ncbi:MAG: gluconokinase [Cyclobacteriaceae bacterium]
MDKIDFKYKIIFVIGVSGSGKSLIGKKLAEYLDIPFVDADDHHPTDNIMKMSQGIPLTDKDRFPWLRLLNKIAADDFSGGCVIACSALKQAYRDIIKGTIESRIVWIYLHGTFEQIYERMRKRKGHFMSAGMLKSQFEILEEPREAIKVEISDSPEAIIENIKTYIQ